jgi:hypothetical protein
MHVLPLKLLDLNSDLDEALSRGPRIDAEARHPRSREKRREKKNRILKPPALPNPPVATRLGCQRIFGITILRPRSRDRSFREPRTFTAPRGRHPGRNLSQRAARRAC